MDVIEIINDMRANLIDGVMQRIAKRRVDLSTADRRLIEAICRDALTVQLMAATMRTGIDLESDRQRVSTALRQVRAQLGNLHAGLGEIVKSEINTTIADMFTRVVDAVL